jgi:putative oxidoreductase
MADSLARWAPVLRSVLRIAAAFLFMAHGTQKLFGFPSSGRPTVALFSQMGLAGVLEVGGGLLLLFGLWTRPMAFILSGLMAWAYFQAHAPGGFWPILNRGELAVLYCFLWLYLAAAGAGPISVDGIVRKKK